MTSPRVRFGLAAGVVAASVLGLIVWGLAGSGSTAFYRTPSELTSEPSDPRTRIRVAGVVVAGSVIQEGPSTRFDITDGRATVRVTTEDVLPDTFGAGVEVVAEGALTAPGEFSASTVLAKCPSKFKAKRSES